MTSAQHVYSMRLSVQNDSSQESIIGTATSLISEASAHMLDGVSYQSCQIIIQDERIEDIEDYCIVQGALLVEVEVACDDTAYQEWYWDRESREGVLNQFLGDGKGPVRWIDLRAV